MKITQKEKVLKESKHVCICLSNEICVRLNKWTNNDIIMIIIIIIINNIIIIIIILIISSIVCMLVFVVIIVIIISSSSSIIIIYIYRERERYDLCSMCSPRIILSPRSPRLATRPEPPGGRLSLLSYYLYYEHSEGGRLRRLHHRRGGSAASKTSRLHCHSILHDNLTIIDIFTILAIINILTCLKLTILKRLVSRYSNDITRLFVSSGIWCLRMWCLMIIVLRPHIR